MVEIHRNRFGQRQELIPCERCGAERWVAILRGKPVSKICASCHYSDITGKNSPSYRNGEKRNSGYVYLVCKGHPSCDVDGYVPRGRLVLEKKLGRYLLKSYHMHHLNGITDDDRPENLIELSPSAHSTLHAYNRKCQKQKTKRKNH